MAASIRLAGGSMKKVALAEGFAAISEYWRPKVIAEPNGQQLKLVKFRGTFIWHRHDAEDEMFVGWRGRFRVEFRDRVVELGPGDLVVVPKGVEHRTSADDEVEVLVFEPASTRNTGNVVDPVFTAPA